MKFNIGDNVVYTAQGRSSINYNHFGVVQKRKSCKNLARYSVFFPKEGVETWMAEEMLTLQHKISKEDLL